MLALEFRFPAGRYHANPWFTNVTEAQVAWPPEPVRILRALIATWHRKADQSAYPEATLESLIEKLASEAPAFGLPPAVRFHTRHYMPTREGKKVAKKLVFDGFAHIHKDSPLRVAWSQTTLTEHETHLLEHLAERIGYLGRAESWVEANCYDCQPSELNCFPDGSNISPDGEARESLSILASKPANEYRQWRDVFVTQGLPEGLRPAKKKAFHDALPSRFLDALSLDTHVVQAAGMREPPATQWQTYHRATDAFSPRYTTQIISAAQRKPPTTARFVFLSPPFPRMEDAIEIGEQLRRGLMGYAKKSLGADSIPAVIHGHGNNGKHQHAFFLPEADQRGQIRHILIQADSGFDEATIELMHAIKTIPTRDKRRRAIQLEAIGDQQRLAEQIPYLHTSQRWQSVTPYLMPWHQKKRFGIAEQISKEWGNRTQGNNIGVEVVTIEETITLRGARVAANRFKRRRPHQSSMRPDRRGQALTLEFSEPVSGPIALGYGCHFGLGLFRPVD